MIDRTHLATLRGFAAGQASTSDDDDYGTDLYNMRGTFRGERKPDGWPEGSWQIHCESCDVFHAPFHYQNIQPLLRFMEDFDLCFHGYDAQILMQWKIFFTTEAPKE
jgi:hypothetical protein